MAAEQEEAAILSAAEAQTREEEAIRDRLPREVLNINRRLEEQHLDKKMALDNIHGVIAKLTAMVGDHGVFIAPTLLRAAFPRYSIHPGHRKTFLFRTTTTTLLSLSPIYELPTPASSTPQFVPQYGMPIHFGQLSPQQLPHPVFPASTSTTTQPIYTIPPPLTTTIPPSSGEIPHLS
jgi:hypothetical protein